MERLSWRPHNRYSGRLSNEGLIAEVATLLGSERVWSATQFNELGSCGFRFFAHRLLELEALEEPEEGLDARQLGTINHEILEKTYRRLAQMGATLTPEFGEHALAILRKVAVDVLRDAPRKLGFRVAALWEQEQDVIVRRLEALVRLDFSADSPILKKFGYAIRQPYRLETPFGHSDGPPVTIPLGDDQPPLRVQGTIDRMDRVGDGVVVVDYKSGSTKIPVEEMAQGRNFQMMVYLLAAEAILAASRALGEPHTVIGGLFWHLRDLNVSGEVPPEHEANDRARQHLATYIARGRQGDFAAHPNRLSDGRCGHYCEYHQLCRVGSTNRHKREQLRNTGGVGI
jgi:ATP-dependent helicase/DNAse subunit B